MYESSDDDDEARVYVNNQNTSNPTVIIPTSASMFRREWSHRVHNMRTSFNFSRSTKGNDYRIPQSTDSAKSGPVKGGAASTLTPPSSRPLQRSEVHPHLEDVYQRVMRRLQRKANYEDIDSTPLAVQLGIIDIDGETIGQKNCETTQSISGFSPEMRGSLHQQPRESASISSLGAAWPRGQGSSVGGRSSTKRKPHATSIRRGGSNTTGDDSTVDDTLFLAQQPCPKTLRLVIEHVMGVVQSKLCVANNGSLKDCLRFVFESRSLLDRLLKEIPTYSHFQGEGDRLPSAAHIQQMYQEFRNAPVILPMAQYAMEPGSGRVLACLTESTSEGLSPPARLPRDSQNPGIVAPIPLHPQQSITGASFSASAVPSATPAVTTQTPRSASSTTRVGLVEIPSTVTLPGGGSVALPVTYGLSSRRMQVAAGVASGRPHSVSSHFALPTSSFASSALSPSQTETHSAPALGDDTARFVNEAGAALDATDRTIKPTRSVYTGRKAAPLTEQRCRATQYTSVATITDINEATIVSRDVYDSLQAEKEGVEVECAELRGRIEELSAQLEEEKLYTSRKQKVVQYLRETLYKECCVLRSQLSHAQQKEVQYQSHLREAREVQAHASVVNTVTEGGRSAAVSMEASTRFPSLVISSRRQQSDNYVLGSYPSHVVHGSTLHHLRRRATSTVGEEREEAVGTSGGGTTRMGFSVDITAIHSLLDLVLLAVEQDTVLPDNTSKGRSPDLGSVSEEMKDEPFKVQHDMVDEFLKRQRHMKETFKASRVHMANVIASKDRQIHALKFSSDVVFFKDFWDDKSVILRTELRRLRRDTQELLRGMNIVIISTQSALVNRCNVAESAMHDNQRLSASQTALRDIISSAHSLLLPMMTTEYTRGYHPWPLRLRNSMDPLARMIQSRYGQSQLVEVREELNMISSIYTELHHFVMSIHTEPSKKRPAVGSVLRSLCASLVLTAATQTDLFLQVRERYQHELHFGHRIARINTAIMAYIYRQRVVSERSMLALREAGMDPMLTSMPAQMTINKLAEELRRLTTERTLLRKQRLDNAREVYRLWKNKQIDIYEGHTPPAVAQRLVFLEEAKNRRSDYPIPSSTNPTASHSSTIASPNTPEVDNNAPSFWDRVLSFSGDTQLESPVVETPNRAYDGSKAGDVSLGLGTAQKKLGSGHTMPPRVDNMSGSGEMKDVKSPQTVGM